MTSQVLSKFAALMLVFATHSLVHAETPDYELVCRTEAKEVAAKAYRGCISEARTTQIEQLKKEYQERLKAMKEDYEKEIKKLAGSKAAKKSLAKKTAKAAGVTIQTISPSERAVGQEIDEVQVQLKPSVNAPTLDESTMDLPEPLPTESGASL